MKRSRLRPVSEKRRAYEDECFQAKIEVRKRSQGYCESWPFVRDYAPNPDLYHGLPIAALCQFRNPIHVHHRRFRSRGGTNILDNLVHLCEPCHSWVHANPEMSHELRLSLHFEDSESLARVSPND